MTDPSIFSRETEEEKRARLETELQKVTDRALSTNYRVNFTEENEEGERVDGELRFTTEPLPGADPAVDWGEVIREAKDGSGYDKIKAALQSQCRPHEILEAGHEAPMEEVLKLNKDGSINAQSDLGKLAKAALENDWEVKFGKSVYRTEDKVVGSETRQDGRRSKEFRIVPGKVGTRKWFEAAKDGVRISASDLPHYVAGKMQVTKQYLEERIRE